MAERLTSPLKWAGSKKWAVPLIGSIYHHHRARRLVEPFVGGMNVALGLRPEEALLADANPHLINFYEHLQKGLVITLEMRNDEALYKKYRETFNGLIEVGCLHEQEMAQLFYYLNRNGFNGLCRFNSSGLFNVPFGRYDSVNFRTDFTEYRETLSRWLLVRTSFEWLFGLGGYPFQILPDDFIFADPPYDGTFADYSSGGFSWEQQVKLAEFLAAHKGPSIATNAATPRIVELYRKLGFKVDLIPAPRSIAASGNREDAMEIFATKNLDAVITTALNVRAVAVENESGSESGRRTSTSTEIESEDEMAGLPKEMADEVGRARVAGGGSYIQHGDYVMMIDRWFFQKIQDRCIIQELTPAEAIKKVVYEGAKKVEQDPNPPGSSCSAAVNFDGAGKLSAQSNSRAPVIALFGFNDGEIPDATAAMSLRQVCKEDESDADLKGVPIQPARGMLIGLRTYPKEVQSRKGSYITGHNWYCIAKPGTGINAPELVKARLDAKVVGPEAFVKCVTEQLVAARAAGQVVVPADELPGTAAQTGAAAPTLPGAPPTLPQQPPPIVVVDPLAGWTFNPQNPAGAPDPYYYKGQEQKRKSELLAAAQK